MRALVDISVNIDRYIDQLSVDTWTSICLNTRSIYWPSFNRQLIDVPLTIYRSKHNLTDTMGAIGWAVDRYSVNTLQPSIGRYINQVLTDPWTTLVWVPTDSWLIYWLLHWPRPPIRHMMWFCMTKLKADFNLYMLKTHSCGLPFILAAQFHIVSDYKQHNIPEIFPKLIVEQVFTTSEGLIRKLSWWMLNVHCVRSKINSRQPIWLYISACHSVQWYDKAK